MIMPLTVLCCRAGCMKPATLVMNFKLWAAGWPPHMRRDDNCLTGRVGMVFCKECASKEKVAEVFSAQGRQHLNKVLRDSGVKTPPDWNTAELFWTPFEQPGLNQLPAASNAIN